MVVFVGLERRVFHGMKDFSLCARGIFFWGGMRRRDGRGEFSNWGGSELGNFWFWGMDGLFFL